jgi:signal transduction histidine kinase
MDAVDTRIVLVVEDAVTRERLAKMLRRLRYDVTPVARADEALALLRAQPATDAVVMQLPIAEAERLRHAQAEDPKLSSVAMLDVPVPLDAFALYEQLTRLRPRSKRAPRQRDDGERDDDDLVPFLKQSLETMVTGLPAAVSMVRALNEDSAPIEEMMREAMRGVARADAYLEYVNAFSGDRATRGPVDLRRTIEAVLAVSSPKVSQHAMVQKRLDDVPLVVANGEQLSQIFFSLVINAAQAIPEGNPAANRVGVSTFTDDEGWAVVEISDSGSGIAPELLTKIFEPFYSTKRGAGLGMGLFVVRNVVTMLRGRIAVQSEVGRGTTFRVSLPPAQVDAP